MARAFTLRPVRGVDRLLGALLVAACWLPFGACRVGCVRPSDGPGDRARRLAMVREQLVGRDIRDVRVLAAMEHVPRHAFVPAGARAYAYADCALPISHGQTISQPYIVALMTQLAGVGKGSRVLEVGTGSGYQAAVLAEMGCEVWSVEIVCPLAVQARKRLASLGYRGVRIKCADGYLGWPGAAPFDAILVTAAPSRVPPPLLEQLAPGGRMVLPLGETSQQLVLIEKAADGTLERHEVTAVRFVPMTGKAEGSAGN